LNTLFTRTLLWFIATVILTFVAIMIAAALDIDPGQRRRGPLGSLISQQFAESVHAYETGGRQELAAALERFRDVTDTEGVLTDRYGRDLLTGEDRSDLAREARRQRRGPMWRRSRTVFARRSEDGRYMYFAFLQQRSVIRFFLQPEINLTILGVLALLSYGFARHLTNPVRRLQSVVEQFGRGNFSVRARSNRGDEIGSLARSFDQMADRIGVLLQAERRLLQDISHELRSPLARLSLAVELARSDDDPSRHLDRIEREAERLNALVGELLQVTRVEGDTSRMRHEELDLGSLVSEMAEDARLEAEERGARIEPEIEGPVTINGDRELVRRAVENVMRNAVRYAPAGTAVTVRVRRADDGAVIEIRDCGPGVPEDQLSRIFEPFYRVDTDRDRASGGVGLGLAIAKRAVEAHGGSVTARNAGPGLQVSVRLPK
jgi:two-component system sensor histidine kinase CpxA